MRLKEKFAYVVATIFATVALGEIFIINRLEQQEALEAAVLAGNTEVEVMVGVYRIGCEPDRLGYINAWERDTNVTGGQTWLKPLLTRSIRAVVCDNSNGPKQDSVD